MDRASDRTDANSVAELIHNSCDGYEDLAVTIEALEMAGTYSDDKLLTEMLLDAVGNDSDFQKAFIAQCRDILEGPYPDGKCHVTSDFKQHIQAVARQRFEEKALEAVRS